MSDAESLYQSYRASEAEIEQLQAAVIRLEDVLREIRAKAVSGQLVEKDIVAMIDAAK